MIAHRAADERFMAEALRLAARIPCRTWPNPPVGAVVVRDGEIVGRGAHHGPGTRHAEIVALAEAGTAAEGATLYCTLEPCNHTGRTPPCAPEVARSGVRRVVVAVADPNPKVAGGGLNLLHGRGIEIQVGVGGRAALELIWPFVSTDAFIRPYVVLKTATSLDGCFTCGPPDRSGGGARPQYLTQPAARRDVHRLRRWMDLVLIGEGTLQVDRPRLDGRLVTDQDDCPAVDPAAGYVDTDLSYREGWRRAGYYVFTGRAAAPEARATVEADGGVCVLCRQKDGHVDLHSLLAEAHRGGIQCVMVEGGPHLAARFLVEKLVDRWVRYVAPITVGEGLRWPPPFVDEERTLEDGLTLSTEDGLGRDRRLIFDRRPFARTLQELTTAAELRPPLDAKRS